MNVTQADRDIAKTLFLISEIERLHPDTVFTIGVVPEEETDEDDILQDTDPLKGIAMVHWCLFLPNSPDVPDFEKSRTALPKIKEFFAALPSFIEKGAYEQLHFIRPFSRKMPALSAHEKMEILIRASKISDGLV